MKKFIFIWVLAACGIASNPAAQRLEVVATLPDLGSVVAEVGGAFIHLSTLANPAEDPHFVDPRPSFVKILNKADLLIEGGADLEAGWLPPLVQNARNAKILPGQTGRLLASVGLEIKEKPAGPVDRSQGDVHPAGNPHFLLDPRNAGHFADHVAQRLGELDPAHAADFTANARRFNGEIENALPEFEKSIAPAKGQKLITYHRSFPYFLDRFGLELFDTIEPKPGVEPSPAHIASLIQRAKVAAIKIILIEENRPRKTADRIAKEIGARVAVAHHMPEAAAGRYLPWIGEMVGAVQKSLP